MKLDRLHFTLGVLLAMGVAFRAVREGTSPGPSRGASNAALSHQISEVSSRRRAGKQKGSPPAGKALGGPVLPRIEGTGAPLRSEVTPVGALAPGSASRLDGARAALRVDLDVASAASIESLPRIGPALARRIVEDRIARGPFGSLQGLDRVRGIGPALQKVIAPYVTFSTAGRPSTVAAVPLPEENAGRGKGRRRPPARVIP